MRPNGAVSRRLSAWGAPCNRYSGLRGGLLLDGSLDLVRERALLAAQLATEADRRAEQRNVPVRLQAARQRQIFAGGSGNHGQRMQRVRLLRQDIAAGGRVAKHTGQRAGRVAHLDVAACRRHGARGVALGKLLLQGAQYTGGDKAPQRRRGGGGSAAPPRAPPLPAPIHTSSARARI